MVTEQPWEYILSALSVGQLALLIRVTYTLGVQTANINDMKRRLNRLEK